MATTKITNPELFDLGSLNTALKLPSGTTAERPTSPSTGEWRYNTTTNLVEFWDGGEWRDLQSENIPPINSENFNTVIWTGTGSAQTIEVGFQPDMIWYKARNQAYDHNVYDSTRGLNVFIRPNSNIAQYSASDQITGVTSTGFTLGTGNDGNQNGTTFVAWCWKANGGTTSSNTDGTIASTVQVNSKAGFSIVSNTGNGVQGATIGHGLGVAPELIILKDLTAANHWLVGNSSSGWTKAMHLDLDNADNASNLYWADTAPTSTVYSVGFTSGAYNVSGNDYIAYCFTPVVGYSKFGTYTGNGSTNGPTVNTGFEPAFVIIKRTSGSGDWRVYDNKRGSSSARYPLYANLNNVEGGGLNEITFLSNGFQLGSATNVNDNGQTYIYIVFGSDASAAPALADSFATALYTGNSTSQSITGLGFQPNLTWIKDRSATRDHNLTDSVRGVTHPIYMTTQGQLTNSTFLTSFDSDGFSLGNQAAANENGETFVAWNWKANPLPTINTDGDTQAIVSANVAAGFSIISYTGTGSVQTVGHGLSAAPEMIILKKISNTQNWNTGADGIGWTKYFDGPNTANVAGTETTVWNDTAPTSTVVTLGGSNNTNANGENYIMYAWYSIAGFSKMGSYAGTGSPQTITTGFAPNYVMIKCIDQNEYWAIFDTSRFNTSTEYKVLYANRNDAETAFGPFSFTANGFTVPASSGMTNGSGLNYIYMAYKENPAQYAIPSGEMGYLVAAGGGSGFYSTGAGGVGGGGAGGFRTTYGLTSGGGASAETNLTLATGTYTVTIGAGGAMTSGAGNDGNDSSITGLVTITTTGGGAGGGGNAVGSAGGSGGGAGELNSGTSLAGGAGTANQGFTGGTSVVNFNGAGGGGASSVGANNGANLAGNGGAGITSAITGSNVGYAGGGGGAAYQSSSTGGNGTYGGGDGTLNGIRTASTAGGINTGGGGGALGGSIGAGGYTTGGSGIVVLRMNTSDFSGATSGSPTISAIGSETILQYLASGSYTHNPSTAAGTMNYMVLAGGASGASNGGGGGAGGLRSSWYASGGGAGGEAPLTLSSGTYTITIGAGGAEVTTYQDPGNDGTATTISGNATVNTVGGGGGGSNNTNAGRNGGSGGGAGAHPGAAYNGGSGTAGEGFDGGRAGAVNQPYSGAGGGGTGAVGEPNSASAAGAGGNGLALGITGALVNYGGGGGGSGGTPTGGLSGGAGGAGGGGAGGAYNSTGIAGTVNTGGGGGGSGDNVGVGGAGGSGKVILRLITSEYSGTTTGSPTVTTVGTETVLTFTGSGTYVHS